jgi:regulator of replication initiation timing
MNLYAASWTLVSPQLSISDSLLRSPQELKAIIPSPVLKSCLDDMALDKSEGVFADSDDEEEKAPKKKAEPKASDDPYKGALSFKSGKSANSCLYYVDYTKLKNNGDGLLPDERNELTTHLHKTIAELDALKMNVKTMTLETDKLLSEPTNEELDARLEADETNLAELREQAEAGRKLKVNEKYKQQIKRRIDAMTTVWRKRRRICMDFLIAMEENTDGTVNVKKCLKGDGQIDIDSDEAIVSAAVEYGMKQRARPASHKMKRISGIAKTASKSSTTSGLTASESFVAVTLDSQGRIQRVHLEDEA